MRGLRLILLLAMLLPCAACGTTPAAGPNPSGIYFASARVDNESFTYELFDVDDTVLNVLTTVKPPSLAGRLGRRPPPPSPTVGVGDVLIITIFESAAGGLFSTPVAGSTSSQSLALPPQTVDRDGTVSVPYAGKIEAAGMTPSEIGDAIIKKLNKKAIEPQVVVTIANNASRSATVIGDVTAGGRVPLNVKGDRLLEVISQAGGVRALPHETFITVSRGDARATARLATILNSPPDNIMVWPGDTIYVAKEPQTFTALGAVTLQGDLPIDRAVMTLSDAVGKAGGLSDLLADTSAIFLFRWERPEVVRRLLPTSRLLRGNKPVPVVYRLSFRSARGYFWARAFNVANKDIVFVANAPTVEFLKFMRVVQSVASTARSIQSVDPNTPLQ